MTAATHDLLDWALTAHRAGLCVLPPREDGTKGPFGEWKRFQTERPNEDAIRAWYANGRTGLGFVCGAISGNLEMLEFEARAVEEGLDLVFADLAAAAGIGDVVERIAKGYLERTPSSGVHIMYRCETAISGNLKLARRLATPEELAADPADRYKVLIETRGEGGYTIAAPSHGRVHPTGKAWDLIAGGPDTIVTITAAERSALLAVARTFDQIPDLQPAKPATSTVALLDDGNDLRPGDDFEQRATWPEILEPHGWTRVYERGETMHWRRPGKHRGISATTNALGTNRLKVFSSSTPFSTDGTHSKFEAYAVLHHGGDHAEAARALRQAGYGSAPRHDDFSWVGPNGTKPASQSVATTSNQPAPAAQQPPPEELIALIRERFGVSGPDAVNLAIRLQGGVTGERLTSLARRLVRDEDMVRDAALHTIDVVTAADLLARERPPRRSLLGDLIQEGHNVTIVARYKAGKSTLVENMAMAAVTGGLFLARFPVAEPIRVVLLNYELDERDMDLRIRGLNLPVEAQQRLLVLNLRGQRLPLMTPVGREWLVARLKDFAAELLIVDPFGAAYAAAGGESENDNAEVRRFTTALDEIKRLAECSTLAMPVHTGRAEQTDGDERGRGATVLDDWPDVRMLLTVDERGDRYLRTDGRATSLSESRLGFDPANRRLMLAPTDVGLNRRKARQLERQSMVIHLVRDNPGINARNLRDMLTAGDGGRHEDLKTAIDDACLSRSIHVHDGPNRARLHYWGEPHLDDENCPGGWHP